MGQTLRVGLLLDSLTQPRWAAQVIAGIQALSEAEIVVVALVETPVRSVPLLFQCFTRLDALVFRSDWDASAPVSVAEQLADYSRLHLRPAAPSTPVALDAAGVATLQTYALDVLVNLSRQLPDHLRLPVARFGIWSLVHAENLDAASAPPGVWEVLDGMPTTGALLVVSTGEPAAVKVVFRSYGCTARSVTRNLHNNYWKSVPFIPRTLQALAKHGPAIVEGALAANCLSRPASRRTYPSGAALLPLLIKLAGRYLGSKVNGIRSAEQWSIALITGEEVERARRIQQPPRVQVLVPPAGLFWADPFPVRVGGACHLFIEEFDEAKGKAHIAVLAVDDAGRCGAPAIALERAYHLSYPFVFTWQGCQYMLPETRANRTVELYQADPFPYRWTLAQVLLRDINATDATIVPAYGRWWLFVTIGADGAPATDELHLFHAESPLGPWLPHDRNPVKSDVRAARPAGRIIWRDGVYFRPAQDCSGRYGRSLVLHRIVDLSPDLYREEPIGTIEAESRAGLLAVHTINGTRDLLCLDGVLRRDRVPRRLRTRDRRGTASQPWVPATLWDRPRPAFRWTDQSLALLDTFAQRNLNPFVTGGQPG